MIGARNAGFATTLVDEWVRHGLTDAVIAPGSRSAPLALACARNPRVRVHVFVDERSASFFALGLGRSTGRPALVLCTSGTAAAHFHAAVLEAHHGRVPLLVCTADRPPELHGIGAPQTMHQEHLYGSAVRAFESPGPPDDATDASMAGWRPLASRAYAAALGTPAPGPVHLNLAFREPLVTRDEPTVAPGRDPTAPWFPPVTPAAPRALTVDGGGRVLIVAGWGADRELGDLPVGVPVLADPLSNLRTGPHAITTAEGILRTPGFREALRPDLVIRVGGPMTSRVVMEWLGPEIRQIVIDPHGAGLDPQRAAAAFVPYGVSEIRFAEPLDQDFAATWFAAERAARAATDAELDARGTAPDAGRVARDVAAAVPASGALVVGSSMPVRDLDWCMAARSDLTLHANRGVNGIDGFVSTTLGIAAGSAGPVVGFTGDLGFLHDSNGLAGAPRRNVDAVFVVVDNRGGAIFSFLPQGDPQLVDPPTFELLFGTPVPVDLVALAAAHGVPADAVDEAAALRPAIRAGLAAGGVRVLVVPTDRKRAVADQHRIWAAISAAVRPLLG